MGGLQHKLINRSKSISGQGIIEIPKSLKESQVVLLEKQLRDANIQFSSEYVIELLIKYNSILHPAIVHGVSESSVPRFLSDQDFEIILPIDLAYRLNVSPPEILRLVSPSHTDSFFEDIPRYVSVELKKIISTDVPEIDAVHAWVKLSKIQNLIGEKRINTIRIFQGFDQARNVVNQYSAKTQQHLKSWEDENATLVWALNLESSIIVFLFAAMSGLVALCILSGLFIFWSKIKSDLAAFWIMGSSFESIKKNIFRFFHLKIVLTLFFGIAFGLVFLFLFDHYGVEILPEVFVERKIPIFISAKAIILSFLIPYLISMGFIFYSIKEFEKDSNFLEFIRSY